MNIYYIMYGAIQTIYKKEFGNIEFVDERKFAY